MLRSRVLALNSLAGLVSTLINVYSQQRGRYSITAKVTVMVTAGCTVLMAALFLLYNNWILQNVREDHAKELGVDVEDKKEKKRQQKEKQKDMKQKKRAQSARWPEEIV